MTRNFFYHSAAALIIGSFLLSGCNSTQPTPDTESETGVESSTEMKAQDSAMETEQKLSTSTEVDDLEQDLENTTIGTEDFSDL